MDMDEGQGLLEACNERGDLSKVKELLLLPELDVNKRDSQGNTALMLACWNSHLDIVEVLLRDTRIDVNLYNNKEQTAFYLACANGETEIVKLLLKNEMLDHNKPNKYCQTPLFIAAYYGFLPIIQWILESGREIDIDSKDKDGQSALFIVKKPEEKNIWETESSYQKRCSSYKEIAIWLDLYKKNPELTRSQLKKRLNL